MYRFSAASLCRAVLLTLTWLISSTAHADLQSKLRDLLFDPPTPAPQKVQTMNRLEQQLAVPAYFVPDPESCPKAPQPTPYRCPWKRVLERNATAFVVIRPGDGPGSREQAGPGTLVQLNYARQIAYAHQAGKKVLAYIPTHYATMSGQHGLDAAKERVRHYMEWYNDKANGVWIDGFFLDQVSDFESTLPVYYRPLTDYIRQQPGRRPLIVLNPAAHVSQSYLRIADVIVTFDSSYEEYLSYTERTPLATLGWEAKEQNAKRIWHIVRDVKCNNYASEPKSVCLPLQKVMQLTKNRNAGYVYITEDSYAAPFDAVPAREFWRDESWYAEQPVIP